MKRSKFTMIVGILLMIFLSCGEAKDELPSDDNNGNKCEEFLPGDTSDCSGDEEGFCAMIKVVNADGCYVDKYTFEDPDAYGIIGGINYILYFTATQKSHQNPNNRDFITFQYDLYGEGYKTLMNISPEGLKLHIIIQGEFNEFVIFVAYVENYNYGSDSSDKTDSVENNSYVIINSFEKTGEWQYLLVGSIKYALILESGSRRIIEGDFSIPIMEGI